MSAVDVWIRDDASFDGLLRQIGEGPLAVDLEADSFHHYQEQICLVQISAAGVDRLVDPLAGVDLGRAAGVLANPAVRKIFHGADYDLRMLDRDHAMPVAGLFDTMIAARLTGHRRFGLAALLEQHFGVRLDKSHQRADWSRRPLPDAMVDYALEDTRHLERLADLLERRLDELGRTDWALEEFARLEAVRWTAPARDEERFRRVKGARGLDRRQWTVLKSLHAWRDDRARQRDVPPFRIASDAVLVTLAVERPRAVEALARTKGLPRGLRRGAPARDLVEAIVRGLDAPEVDPPGPGRRPPELGVDEAKLRRLRKLRDEVARELDLEPALVATRKVLEDVAVRAESGEAWDDVDDLRRWQRPLLRPAVEAIWNAPATL